MDNKSIIHKKICIRNSLLNTPDPWLCLIFTYLSHDHHLLILPFVCKRILNIIAHKNSWPPEFSFNELTNLEKYKNYPFKFVKIKTKRKLFDGDYYYKTNIFQLLSTMPITNLIFESNSGMEGIFSSGYSITNRLEYLTLWGNEIESWNWDFFFTMLSKNCKLKGLKLIGYYYNIFHSINKLKLKELEIGFPISGKIMEKINISELETLSLILDDTSGIVDLLKRIQENNFVLRNFTVSRSSWSNYYDPIDSILCLDHLKLEKLCLSRLNSINFKIHENTTTFNLRELVLKHTRIQNEYLKQLFKKSPNLTVFKFGHHINDDKYNIQNDALEELCKLNIQTLELKWCPLITNDGFQFIKNLKLRELCIIECSGLISNYLQYISNMPLIYLELAENYLLGGKNLSSKTDIKDDDFKCLQYLPLTQLHLSGLQINGSGLKYLVKTPIKTLKLDSCDNIMGDSLELLYNVPYMERIYINNYKTIHRKIILPKNVSHENDGWTLILKIIKN
jgi:hypothetical protein